MYLQQVVVENSGPLTRLRLTPSFTLDGSPKPIVLVGSNGGGKTNLLSLVADALFEAAANHYTDVLPQQGQGRAWFRVVGGATTTVGAGGGFTILEFVHSNESLIYKEKSGTYSPDAAKAIIPQHLLDSVTWPETGNVKEFAIDDEKSKIIFEQGAYAYFPSSRSEVPFWMNESAVVSEFIDEKRFASRLNKSLFIERSLHGLKQWLMSLIADARIDISIVSTNTGKELRASGDVGSSVATAPVLDAANRILRMILGDEQVYFVWLGRKSSEKIGVAKNGQIYLPNLSALSSGQSILLGVFGTLLRYGDASKSVSGINLNEIEGICLIDEIDAHVHIELQTTILPELISMFPKVQFIVSSHSPLFSIGMNNKFGPDGFQLIEMPEGKSVAAESYAEFGKAFEALAATETFTSRIEAETGKAGLPLVYVEGETDEPYLQAAATALGREDLLDRCEIRWIGAKDENGQGFHTGKDAMKHTLSVLRANPQLAARPILLLNDNDTSASAAEYGSLWVRKLPISVHEKRIKAGIENLLPADSITDQDYQEKEISKPNGDMTKTWTLRKGDLCARICGNPDRELFAEFLPAISVIDEFIAATAS